MKVFLVVLFCFLACDGIFCNTNEANHSSDFLADPRTFTAVAILVFIVGVALLFVSSSKSSADFFEPDPKEKTVSEINSSSKTNLKNELKTTNQRKFLAKLQKKKLRKPIPQTIPMVPSKTFLAPPPSSSSSPENSAALQIKVSSKKELVHSRVAGIYSPDKPNGEGENSASFKPTFVLGTNPVSNLVTPKPPTKVEPTFTIEKLIQQMPTLGDGLDEADKLQPTAENVDIAESSDENSPNKKKSDPFDIFKERSGGKNRKEVSPEISWPSKYFAATIGQDKMAGAKTTTTAPTIVNKKDTPESKNEWKPSLNFSG